MNGICHLLFPFNSLILTAHLQVSSSVCFRSEMPHVCFLLFMSTNSVLVLTPSRCFPPPWSFCVWFLPFPRGHHRCLLTWQIWWRYTLQLQDLQSWLQSQANITCPIVCYHGLPTNFMYTLPLTPSWAYFSMPSYSLFPLSGMPFSLFATHPIHKHLSGVFSSAFPNPSRWSNILPWSSVKLSVNALLD